MELGKRILQARLEAGLSQRQLCGETITRNMLSQIEHGTARPSMDTLSYLARQLGKPVSYFLDEQTLDSPNQQLICDARSAFDTGDYAAAMKKLDGYQHPDPVFDREKEMIVCLSCLELARAAIADGKLPYARELLERSASAENPYFSPPMERERLLLLSLADPGNAEKTLSLLPGDDRELLLRAECAMEQGLPLRCIQLLTAAEDHTSPEWNLLMGKALAQQQSFAQAIPCLQIAEERFPRQAIPLLERCFRETEDYKMAYFYACKSRDL